MGQCVTCGNDYDKSFEILKGGQTFTFDSFECAIQKLAPSCEHCQCRIIGHGLESDGVFYCCDHCAEASGVSGLNDRINRNCFHSGPGWVIAMRAAGLRACRKQ